MELLTPCGGCTGRWGVAMSEDYLKKRPGSQHCSSHENRTPGCPSMGSGVDSPHLLLWTQPRTCRSPAFSPYLIWSRWAGRGWWGRTILGDPEWPSPYSLSLFLLPQELYTYWVWGLPIPPSKISLAISDPTFQFFTDAFSFMSLNAVLYLLWSLSLPRVLSGSVPTHCLSLEIQSYYPVSLKVV